jgi:hypothetical protein
MILFDLRCAGGHVFEAWFGSSEAYESQQRQGLVQCPLCDTQKVEKAVMAPRVRAKGNSFTVTDATQMLTAMAQAQKTLLAQSDYVGNHFVDEARAIHLGEADARSIWGTATRDQAASLNEEGIAVTPLPFPAVPPAEEN